MTATKTYDLKCYDLARLFLMDTYVTDNPQENKIKELAEEIQATIEDFCTNLRLEWEKNKED